MNVFQWITLPIVVLLASRRGRWTLVVVSVALLSASLAATLFTTDSTSSTTARTPAPRSCC